MKTKLEHAISLVNRGFYIFPLQANSKVPYKDFHWREESSNRVERVREWAEKYTDCNWAIDTGKSGVFVLDIDVKDGKKGWESFDALDSEFGFPATTVAITASGGEHWLYKTSEHIGNTAGKLGDGLDTRGWGGYIVAAGSTINGNAYQFDYQSPHVPTDLPQWVIDKLAAYKAERQQSNRQDKISEDNPADIERYKKWLLETAALAIEGQNGDHTTYATAAKGREFGLSADSTLELMLDHWNERCEPPWHPDELERKVENAYKYANKAQGASSAQADFDPVPPDPVDNDMVPRFVLPDESDIPARDWKFGNLALAGKVTVLSSSAGSGKSTWWLTAALSKAIGRDLLGIDPRGRGAVMVQNNEDDMMELKRRVVAICKHFNIRPADLLDNDAKGSAARDMFFMQSGEKRPLRIAQRAGASMSIKPLDADKLVAALIANKIEILVVDPFSETHPASENSNEEMLEVAKIYRDVAQRANCAVILIHHDRKPDKASADGHIGNMNSARGASALSGVARVMLTYHTITEKDGKRYGIVEEERHSYARLDFAKANMSATMGEPLFYRRLGQRLNAKEGDPDSGESVGIVVPVKLTAKKSTEGTATFDMLCDIEALVMDAGADGMAVKEIAERLVDAFPAFAGKNPTSLQKAVKRLFADGESLTAAKGVLTLYNRDRRQGEPASMPSLFIKWRAAEAARAA